VILRSIRAVPDEYRRYRTLQKALYKRSVYFFTVLYVAFTVGGPHGTPSLRPVLSDLGEVAECSNSVIR